MTIFSVRRPILSLSRPLQQLQPTCFSHIIRINPPLVISEETALRGLAILDEAMGAMAREWGLD